MTSINRRAQPWLLAALLGAVIALWHGAVGTATGLGDAEALYYAYGLHLAGGYLDHPPLIGWLIAASTTLFGDLPAAVRLVPTILHAATMGGLFVLARDCLGDSRLAFRAVVAMALVPMMTVGGLAAAPDSPASALWVLFAVTLGRALRAHRAGGLRGFRLVGYSLLLGLLLGATFLAKYTGLLLVPAVLAALSHPSHRKLFRTPALLIAAVAALAVASPVVVWNDANGWASLLHRFLWTQSGAGLSLSRLGQALGGQLLYVGPPMLVACAWAVVRLWRRREGPEEWLLLSLSLPALAATFALCALSPAAEPHWPAQGYLALLVAALGLPGDDAAARRLARRFRRASAGYLFFGLVVLHAVVFTTALPRLLGPERYEPRWDLANELIGWPQVAEAVALERDGEEAVAANHYTLCSQLSFSLAGRVGRGTARVLCLSPEVDDFDLWGDGSASGLESVLYVEDDRFGVPAEMALPGWSFQPLRSVIVRRGDWVVRSFRLVRAVPRASEASEPG